MGIFFFLVNFYIVGLKRIWKTLICVYFDGICQSIRPLASKIKMRKSFLFRSNYSLFYFCFVRKPKMAIAPITNRRNDCVDVFSVPHKLRLLNGHVFSVQWCACKKKSKHDNKKKRSKIEINCDHICKEWKLQIIFMCLVDFLSGRHSDLVCYTYLLNIFISTVIIQ